MTTLQERLRAAGEYKHAHHRDLLLEAATALDERETAIEDAIRSWSFSNGQQHTHTWHDRADWIERHRVVGELWSKALLAPREDRP